jgi:hypothetical protein
MRDLVVIDDKDHALKQGIYEFPGTNKNDISFRHFDTIASFSKAGLEDLFISKKSMSDHSVFGPEAERRPAERGAATSTRRHFREKRIILPNDCGSIENIFSFDPVRGV